MLYGYITALLLVLQPANSSHCYIRNINSAECETTLLSEISLDTVRINITSMTLICTNKQLSQFPSAKLSQFNLLQELHIENCGLSKLETYALQGLQELKKINIKGIQNEATKLNINKGFLSPTSKLTDISMTNMGIYQIPNGIFCKLHDLENLDLSRNNIEDLKALECNNSDSLLEWLHIKFNQLKKLRNNQFLFPELLELDLSHNQIETLEVGCFRHLKNLEQINLSNNKLSEIGNLFHTNLPLLVVDFSFNQLMYMSPNAFPISIEYLWLNNNHLFFNDSHRTLFNRLEDLKYLTLSNNKIRYLPSEMFHNLPFLTYLNLSHNSLTPSKNVNYSNQNTLKELDLSYNSFTTVPNLELFSYNVEILYLNFNNITDIFNPSAFKELNTLKELHLRGNKLDLLNFAHFNYLTNLQHLDLASNNIVTTFSNLKTEKLKTIFLQNNQMEKFNLDSINRNIELINLKNNRLRFLLKSSSHLCKLQYLYASNNQLQDISALFGCSQMHQLVLNNNNILNINGINKKLFTALQHLDLRNNSITEIWYQNVRYHSSNSLVLAYPTIDVRQNPITCTCGNDWLLLGDPLYPERLSIKTDNYCKVVYPTLRNHSTQLLDIRIAKKKDMLCEDKITCLGQCSCFYNLKYDVYLVDCFNKSWSGSNSLLTLPLIATTVYFDANSNLESVIGDLLVNSNSVTTLYMNKSELSTINKEMFRGVPNLLELHLENNQLKEITGNEFEFARKLEELFLHNNLLHFIANDAFVNLKLRVLTLHGNQLLRPPLWTMLHHLIRITLSQNPLKCDCDFVVPFQQWVSKNQKIEFQDINETFCGNILVTILDFDTVICIETNTLPIIIPSISFSVFLIVLTIIVYLYRTEMIVWLYSRYGVRLFYKNNNSDSGKVYDAFISYANEDDEWVAEHLVPQLNEYKLCLHQRDFAVGAYIPDSIVAAVENSCRTIIILTPNFLRSHWCRFEFDTAHIQSLVDRCKRLVVVILDEVNKQDTTSNIYAYLKTNTYLDIKDSMFWSKLKFALPDLNRDKLQQEIVLPGLI